MLQAQAPARNVPLALDAVWPHGRVLPLHGVDKLCDPRRRHGRSTVAAPRDSVTITPGAGPIAAAPPDPADERPAAWPVAPALDRPLQAIQLSQEALPASLPGVGELALPARLSAE